MAGHFSQAAADGDAGDLGQLGFSRPSRRAISASSDSRSANGSSAFVGALTLNGALAFCSGGRPSPECCGPLAAGAEGCVLATGGDLGGGAIAGGTGDAGGVARGSAFAAVTAEFRLFRTRRRRARRRRCRIARGGRGRSLRADPFRAGARPAPWMSIRTPEQSAAASPGAAARDVAAADLQASVERAPPIVQRAAEQAERMRGALGSLRSAWRRGAAAIAGPAAGARGIADAGAAAGVEAAAGGAAAGVEAAAGGRPPSSEAPRPRPAGRGQPVRFAARARPERGEGKADCSRAPASSRG